MRQLHPRTIEIIANNPEHPAYPISHCWSEVFKFLGSRQKHPKVFITDDFGLGIYLAYIYRLSKLRKECNLDLNKINSLSQSLNYGFNSVQFNPILAYRTLSRFFNDDYLFSDACSLYYKGVNIFPDLFGEDWKKYVPVENLEEVARQTLKTLSGVSVDVKMVRGIVKGLKAEV